MPHSSKDKKITLLDVAKHAGVSRATASLVIRGSDLVAEKTRVRVLNAMRELGYVYNRAAANLRSQRTKTIGLVVTDITNPFFAELAVSIESQLDDADYAVMLSNTLDVHEKQDRLLRAMRGHQVDGLLLCPAEGSDSHMLEMLNRWGLPYVLVARYVEGINADYAGADNVSGAQQATEYLIEKGHSRIAFLGGSNASSPRRDRLKGYQKALQAHNLPIHSALSIESPVSRQGGFEALLTLMDYDKPPTAAVCYNDVVAFGAMLGLQSRELVPGNDFSIIGFDDVSDAALVRPALTTMSIKPQEIGKAAIDLLIKKIQSPETSEQRVILSPTLVIRDSA